MTKAEAAPASTAIAWGPLLVAIILVGFITVYPPAFSRPDGKPDEGFAMVLMWAIMAGLVRGVGFVPRFKLWRWLFSSWSCYAACAVAVLVRLTHA